MLGTDLETRLSLRRELKNCIRKDAEHLDLYPSFIDKEHKANILINLPRVTQLLNGNDIYSKFYFFMYLFI